MLQSIDIMQLILLFLFGAAISMLGMAFQAFMKPGQIFNWYALFLIKMVEISTDLRKVKDYKSWCSGEWVYKSAKQHWYIKLIAKLSKPLGLCPYCNSTWIAIVFYLIYFKLSFNILLLIGIVWFFVDMMIKRENKQINN